MTECCNDFTVTTETATREPGAVFRPLDDCGDKAMFTVARAASAFRDMMPVKYGPKPGTVEVAPDGVDAVGFVNGTPNADGLVSVTRTGHVFWKDVAAALGLDPMSRTDWWPIYVALAKANIYVAFTDRPTHKGFFI